MPINQQGLKIFLYCLLTIMLSGCANQPSTYNAPSDGYSSNLPLFHGQPPFSSAYNESRYVDRLPRYYTTDGRKLILVDPEAHAWGAYGQDGFLVRGGIATAGADFCQDEKRPCRTDIGTFHLYELGGEDCVSKKFPLGEGGALMPYCMFFHNGQSLHGSPDQMMADANISHGCVHLRIPDAEWLRNHFANLGTEVVILPY